MNWKDPIQVSNQSEKMSSAANTFLRLNSTVSQPGSPTSQKGVERLSLAGSAGGAASGIGATQSTTGGASGPGRCGGACWRYLSSNPKMRKGLAHAGLVLLLCFYTAAGASVTFLQSLVFCPSRLRVLFCPLSGKRTKAWRLKNPSSGQLLLNGSFRRSCWLYTEIA